MAEETGEAIDARDFVVSIAKGELGIQDPDKYWAVVCPALMGDPHGISWCGGFALWCLWQAGICNWNWLIWKGPGTNSGFLFRLRMTLDPKPGDIAYFLRNSHHAVIATVREDSISTIDGNTLRFPQEGVTGPNARSRKDITAYYSISGLISESAL